MNIIGLVLISFKTNSGINNVSIFIFSVDDHNICSLSWTSAGDAMYLFINFIVSNLAYLLKFHENYHNVECNESIMHWPRGNIVTSHAAGLGSIPYRLSFLVEGFPGFSLNCKTNVGKFKPYSFPCIIWPSYIIQTIFILVRTATVSDLSCSRRPLWNNKQQR